MTEHRDVVVIGARQAGLATSYYLTDAGCDHVVLERDRVGERWRSETWDSFTLVTPNVMSRRPGFPYEGDDSDGFLTRDEVVAYLEACVDRFDPPLRTGVEVLAVRRSDTGYGTRSDTNWTNEVTVVRPNHPVQWSLGLCTSGASCPAIFVVSTDDEMVGSSPAVARDAYERLVGPKEWVEIPGGQFGLLYHPSETVDRASSAQVRFLTETLLAEGLKTRYPCLATGL
jgi:choline dehydrogenase-like flavoprotein